MTKRLFLLSSALLGLVGTTAKALADAPAQLQQAETLAKNGQYEQAEVPYQQIVATSPAGDWGIHIWQPSLQRYYVPFIILVFEKP